VDRTQKDFKDKAAVTDLKALEAHFVNYATKRSLEASNARMADYLSLDAFNKS
jgi:hypothetical protein